MGELLGEWGLGGHNCAQKLEEGHTLRCPFANLEDNYREEASLKPHTLKKEKKKVELEGSD